MKSFHFFPGSLKTPEFFSLLPSYIRFVPNTLLLSFLLHTLPFHIKFPENIPNSKQYSKRHSYIPFRFGANDSKLFPTLPEFLLERYLHEKQNVPSDRKSTRLNSS